MVPNGKDCEVASPDNICTLLPSEGKLSCSLSSSSCDVWIISVIWIWNYKA